MGANVRLADIRAAASWMTELLVLFAVEPQGPVDHMGILQEAGRSVVLDGQNATPVYSGNPMLVPSGTVCRDVGHVECVAMQCIVLKTQCIIEGGRMCLAT